jgi:hypothetical protein
MADEEKKAAGPPRQESDSPWHPWEVIAGLLLALVSLLVRIFLAAIVAAFRFVKLQTARCVLLATRAWRSLRGLS